MTGINLRKGLVRAGVAVCLAALPLSASASTILTDGFGDGDRDNNGTAEGPVTNAGDVGVPWFLAAGTSSVNFQVVDDSAASATNGNALQLNNTAANNRPSAGHFSAVTLGDGDNITLSFDMRLVSSSPATSDRSIRFGLYHDTGSDDVAGDTSSTSTVYNNDVGYNARVDDGADVSNSTSMDVTRDDTSDTTAILQATTTSLGITSTNSVNQMSDASYHHFVLSLTRSGTGISISLQKDSNAAITGTDASPAGFTFDEVALGVRSNAAMDLRFDNVQVDYTAAPEPASFGLLAAGAGLLLRRRVRR